MSVDESRICGWCRGSIDRTARRDAVFCRKPCRQAAHRAKVRRAELEATGRPLRLAYADPPYPGLAGYYRDHPDYAGEVDHDELLSRLETYDGWALSTSSAALPDIIGRCVARVLPVRVAVWVHRTSGLPGATGYEAVVYSCGRPLAARDVPNVLTGIESRRRPTLPTAVIGMKPPAFCRWVFELLGATAGDSLDDLYPGSGIVARTWSWYTGVDPSRAAAEADSERGTDADLWTA